MSFPRISREQESRIRGGESPVPQLTATELRKLEQEQIADEPLHAPRPPPPLNVQIIADKLERPGALKDYIESAKSSTIDDAYVRNARVLVDRILKERSGFLPAIKTFLSKMFGTDYWANTAHLEAFKNWLEEDAPEIIAHNKWKGEGRVLLSEGARVAEAEEARRRAEEDARKLPAPFPAYPTQPRQQLPQHQQQPVAPSRVAQDAQAAAAAAKAAQEEQQRLEAAQEDEQRRLAREEHIGLPASELGPAPSQQSLQQPIERLATVNSPITSEFDQHFEQQGGPQQLVDQHQPAPVVGLQEEKDPFQFIGPSNAPRVKKKNLAETQEQLKIRRRQQEENEAVRKAEGKYPANPQGPAAKQQEEIERLSKAFFRQKEIEEAARRQQEEFDANRRAEAAAQAAQNPPPVAPSGPSPEDAAKVIQQRGAAAAKIQQAYKAHREKRVTAATQIQSVVRGFQARQQVKKQKAALGVIQRVGRGYLGRNKAKMAAAKAAEEQRQADRGLIQPPATVSAVQEQAAPLAAPLRYMDRGTRVRVGDEPAGIENPKEMNAEVDAQLQANREAAKAEARRARVTAHIGQRRAEREHIATWTQNLLGNFTKQVAVDAAAKAAKEKAVLAGTIAAQSIVRGFLARSRGEKQRTAATAIQSVWRGHKARTDYQTARTSAIAIQKEVRRHQEAVKVELMRKAAAEKRQQELAVVAKAAEEKRLQEAAAKAAKEAAEAAKQAAAKEQMGKVLGELRANVPKAKDTQTLKDEASERARNRWRPPAEPKQNVRLDVPTHDSQQMYEFPPKDLPPPQVAIVSHDDSALGMTPSARVPHQEVIDLEPPGTSVSDKGLLDGSAQSSLDLALSESQNVKPPNFGASTTAIRQALNRGQLKKALKEGAAKLREEAAAKAAEEKRIQDELVLNQQSTQQFQSMVPESSLAATPNRDATAARSVPDSQLDRELLQDPVVPVESIEQAQAPDLARAKTQAERRQRVIDVVTQRRELREAAEAKAAAEEEQRVKDALKEDIAKRGALHGEMAEKFTVDLNTQWLLGNKVRVYAAGNRLYPLSQSDTVKLSDGDWNTVARSYALQLEDVSSQLTKANDEDEQQLAAELSAKKEQLLADGADIFMRYFLLHKEALPMDANGKYQLNPEFNSLYSAVRNRVSDPLRYASGIRVDPADSNGNAALARLMSSVKQTPPVVLGLPFHGRDWGHEVNRLAAKETGIDDKPWRKRQKNSAAGALQTPRTVRTARGDEYAESSDREALNNMIGRLQQMQETEQSDLAIQQVTEGKLAVDGKTNRALTAENRQLLDELTMAMGFVLQSGANKRADTADSATQLGYVAPTIERMAAAIRTAAEGQKASPAEHLAEIIARPEILNDPSVAEFMQMADLYAMNSQNPSVRKDLGWQDSSERHNHFDLKAMNARLTDLKRALLGIQENPVAFVGNKKTATVVPMPRAELVQANAAGARQAANQIANSFKDQMRASGYGEVDFPMFFRAFVQGKVPTAFFSQFPDKGLVLVRDYIYPYAVLNARAQKRDDDPGIRFFAKPASADELMNLAPGNEREQRLILTNTVEAMYKAQSEGGLGGSPIGSDQVEMLEAVQQAAKGRESVISNEAGAGKTTITALAHQILPALKDIPAVIRVAPFAVGDLGGTEITDISQPIPDSSKKPAQLWLKAQTLAQQLAAGKEMHPDLKNSLILLDEQDSRAYALPETGDRVQNRLFEQGAERVVNMSATGNLETVQNKINLLEKKLDTRMQELLAQPIENGVQLGAGLRQLEADGGSGSGQDEIRQLRATLRNDSASPRVMNDPDVQRLRREIKKEVKKKLELEQNLANEFARDINISESHGANVQEQMAEILGKIDEPIRGKSYLVLMPDAKPGQLGELQNAISLNPKFANSAVLYLDDRGNHLASWREQDGTWTTMPFRDFESRFKLAKPEDRPIVFPWYTTNVAGGDNRQFSTAAKAADNTSQTVRQFVVYSSQATKPEELATSLEQILPTSHEEYQHMRRERRAGISDVMPHPVEVMLGPQAWNAMQEVRGDVERAIGGDQKALRTADISGEQAQTPLVPKVTYLGQLKAAKDQRADSEKSFQKELSRQLAKRVYLNQAWRYEALRVKDELKRQQVEFLGNQLHHDMEGFFGAAEQLGTNDSRALRAFQALRSEATAFIDSKQRQLNAELKKNDIDIKQYREQAARELGQILKKGFDEISRDAAELLSADHTRYQVLERLPTSQRGLQEAIKNDVESKAKSRARDILEQLKNRIGKTQNDKWIERFLPEAVWGHARAYLASAPQGEDNFVNKAGDALVGTVTYQQAWEGYIRTQVEQAQLSAAYKQRLEQRLSEPAQSESYFKELAAKNLGQISVAEAIRTKRVDDEAKKLKRVYETDPIAFVQQRVKEYEDSDEILSPANQAIREQAWPTYVEQYTNATHTKKGEAFAEELAARIQPDEPDSDERRQYIEQTATDIAKESSAKLQSEMRLAAGYNNPSTTTTEQRTIDRHLAPELMAREKEVKEHEIERLTAEIDSNPALYLSEQVRQYLRSIDNRPAVAGEQAAESFRQAIANHRGKVWDGIVAEAQERASTSGAANRVNIDDLIKQVTKEREDQRRLEAVSSASATAATLAAYGTLGDIRRVDEPPIPTRPDKERPVQLGGMMGNWVAGGRKGFDGLVRGNSVEAGKRLTEIEVQQEKSAGVLKQVEQLTRAVPEPDPSLYSGVQYYEELLDKYAPSANRASGVKGTENPSPPSVPSASASSSSAVSSSRPSTPIPLLDLSFASLHPDDAGSSSGTPPSGSNSSSSASELDDAASVISQTAQRSKPVAPPPRSKTSVVSRLTQPTAASRNKQGEKAGSRPVTGLAPPGALSNAKLKSLPNDPTRK